MSGGEPMLQPEFAKEILRLFVAAGIHTALDTNMSVPWNSYRKVLPYTNLVLADLKMIDTRLHEQRTGFGNKRILENIHLLDKSGVPYEIRTPVIPGVNDNDPEINRIIEFISGLSNLSKFTLLPYHAMGSFKYKNLGIANPMSGIPSMDSADLSRFNHILEKYNTGLLTSNE